jgi:transposase
MFLIKQTDNDSLKNIYKALDILDKKALGIQQTVEKITAKITNREKEVVYYDVTNHDFEIEYNDDDTKDEQGNVIKEGLRKRGVSKSHKTQPIVSMGMFIDSYGIPISYKLFPGNTNDQTTMCPAMEESIDNFDADKVIVVADGGLNAGYNLAHLHSNGNGYVVSKSVRKLDANLKKWVLDDSGYKCKTKKGMVTWKVKHRERNRTVIDKKGKRYTVKEKIVCFWSYKHYRRELQSNQSFIEYAKACIEHPEKLKDKPSKVQKFLDEETYDKESGKIIEKTGKILTIDETKLKQWQDLMGYYTIMTSEVEKTDEEIIEIYRGLGRIENAFRTLKTGLNARPVYVRLKEHINAHFLLCFVALVMVRLIQHLIRKQNGQELNTVRGWVEGMSALRIKEALNKWIATKVISGNYTLSPESDDLTQLLSVFGVDIKKYGEVSMQEMRTMRQKMIKYLSI